MPLKSTRAQVFEALIREDNYASGWAGDGRKADCYVSIRTGLPFSEMEWVVFAEKYLNEAKVGYANYVKDVRSIHIRILKAASLLVNAVAAHATPEELLDIAGVSSTKFPLYNRGLQDLKDDPTPNTGDQA